jgi:hypothetical protein
MRVISFRKDLFRFTSRNTLEYSTERSEVMKAPFLLLLLLSVVVLSLAPSVSVALPDTVIVAALPPGNLNNFINADTVAGGFAKPNRVYLLKPTGALDTVYWISTPISVKGNVTLVGYVNPTTGHPPVVAPDIASDNSSVGNFFSPQGDDTLTLKGIYFMGTRVDTVSFTGRFVSAQGSNNTFIIDHCIFENFSGAGTPNLFDAWQQDHMSLYVTNSIFRNMQDDNPQNPGFAWVDPGTYPGDTAVFHNNTFIVFPYILGSSGYGFKYLDFQHNTVFMGAGGGIFNMNQMHNVNIQNNIFYGSWATGYPQSWYWKGGWGSSLIAIDSLRSLAGEPYNMTEAQRKVTITNNAYFWPQQIWDNWNSGKGPGTWSAGDALYIPKFIDTRSDEMLTDKTSWPGFNIANNDSADPGFNSALVNLAAGKMVQFVDTCWANGGTGHGFRPYVYPLYDPPTWEGVPTDWKTKQGYPVPENLAYSNATMQHAGTDGFALGDLNWFPAQLANWHPLAVQSTGDVLPQSFELSQNYPNPFNPSTKIDFSIMKSSQVELKVYNMLGQEVASIVNAMLTAGSYTATFDASRLASGVYLYKLTAGTNVSTKKMVLLK